jgi:hypothetical protein
MKVNNEALHTPLLGDELVENDEESLSQVAHEKKDQDDGNKHPDGGSTTSLGFCDVFWDLVFLLLIQGQMTWSFYMTPATSPTLLGTTPYTLQFITTSIATFGLSIWLFRLSCPDLPKNIRENYVVLMLPEIMTNIVIFILFVLEKMGAAMVALHLGSLLISLAALAGTLHALFFAQPSKDEEQDVESRLQVGPLIV